MPARNSRMPTLVVSMVVIAKFALGKLWVSVHTICSDDEAIPNYRLRKPSPITVPTTSNAPAT